MPKLLRLLLSVFAILTLGVALTACGDDDDSDAAEDTTTTEPSEETDEATDEGEEDEVSCAEGDVFIFPPSAEPDTDADPVNVAVTEEGDGAERVYSFSENAATDLGEVGSYAVTFQNQGEEMHELIVSRINDDETRSVPDLLAAIGQGTDPASFSSDVAATSACPGEETVVGANIENAGRYVLVCTFPVGSLPGLTEAEFPAEAPPHAAQGMVVEMVVS